MPAAVTRLGQPQSSIAKALSTVVAVNIGRARRKGAQTSDGIKKLLEEVGRRRTIEARGKEACRDPWIPDSAEAAQTAGLTDRDLFDAIEFYCTQRGFDSPPISVTSRAWLL